MPKNTLTSSNSLAVVTGASSGIGYYLAKICAQNKFDLLIAADDPKIYDVAGEFEELGVSVEAVETDLSTTEGVDELIALIKGRPVGALLANAGHGLGKGFLDQKFDDWRHVVDTNIIGTLYLVQQVAREMRDYKHGRVLITGSIAGFMPGTYQAVYNGSKAFLDSFSFALRHELKDTGVTVTCLMPGATETEFFDRADMMDTKIGKSEKADPADVAKLGFDAMMEGKGEVIAGWMNKMRAAMGAILPADLTAEMHTKMAKPGSGTKKVA